MTVSISSAARLVCELGGWDVTNLQLQKILYIAHMMYMGKNKGAPLINSFFEAWDYGPVSATLYHLVKQYGDKAIRTGFYPVSDIVNTEEGGEIEKAAEYLLPKPPRRLVGYTHRKGGAWEKNYIPGGYGIIIPNDDILQEYTELFSQ